MKLKNIIKMKYTFEIIMIILGLVFYIIIGNTDCLFVNKLMLDINMLFILSIYCFLHCFLNVEYNLYKLAILFLIIMMSSLTTSAILFDTYGWHPYDSYTKIHKYIPVSVIKDSSLYQVKVIGKNKMLISNKAKDYLSNNLKICKEEHYNSLKIRLDDSVYICE
jgi:hypothetical protein